jgi:hypothetical protein
MQGDKARQQYSQIQLTQNGLEIRQAARDGIQRQDIAEPC